MSKHGMTVGALFVAVSTIAPARAQVTQLVSVDSSGVQGNDRSGNVGLSVSADARFVAFSSDATNLVAIDANGFTDIFVRDRLIGMTELSSVTTGGAQANGISENPAISADGRYVTFDSAAPNLVAGDTNGFIDIFVHDRQTGATELISVSTAGIQANADCYNPTISGDGRFIAFWSGANNLVPGFMNFRRQVYLRDRQTNTTEIISVSSGMVLGDGNSELPSISADGRFVAFESVSDNLVFGDTAGKQDIFVRDRSMGTTVRVSVGSGGAEGNGDSDLCAMCGDGTCVGFSSRASNLVVGDTNGDSDVFVRDLQAGTTSRVSVDSSNVQGNADSAGPRLSANGRVVSFVSAAFNLAPPDTNGAADVFVHDRVSGVTELVSVSSSGTQGNVGSASPSISGDGRFVAFYSFANTLVAGDANGTADVFMRDRIESGFMSMCDPGVAGVIGCPCSNPPAGSDRGCDNSAATGGAALSASGMAYLATDSLVFTTTGEKPTATSILLQGTAFAPVGITYGQGVRCVNGLLKRLFVKGAVAGSITAPDFGAGDPTVSARSTAKGDMIQPGQSRWYLVYYRDPTVLGGCPASSTFNATQTGGVTWWP